MAQGLIGDFPKLGRDTEKEEEEIMKYLEGCLGETRRLGARQCAFSWRI